MTKRCVLAICLFFITSLCLRSQNVEYSFNGRDGNIFYHTVEQGQTVYGISIMYNVSEEDIYRLNPSSREIIKIGEVLKIPQKDTFNPTSEDDTYLFHTIQQGETIYGVSKQYNITPEQLTNVNPGLTPQTFAAGRNIRIPTALVQALPVTEKRMVTREMDYTVQRRETMFSITRKFNVTSEQLVELNPALKNGLRAGMVIKIPVETEETVVITPQSEFDFNTLMAFRNRMNRVDVIRIAVLLPFSVARSDQAQARTEFYEGLLMAVENMQNSGVSIELLAFDMGEGTQKTREILLNETLQHCHLIIGGETNEQIALIADFALNNGIRYVVPFSSSCDMLTAYNASIFQVNTSSQHLYAYVTQWVCSLFANHNIIFVNTNDQKEDKTPFVRALKAELSQRLTPFRDITYNATTFSTDINTLLVTTRPNLIVPLSSSLETLNKIRTPLRMLSETRSAPQITLFGYPEWQRYTDDCLEDFYVLNTHIYTSFFANNLSPDIHQFYAKYRYWFNKNMMPFYPKYALLGYDTGMFFITAIHTFGTNFEHNIRQVNYHSLQNGFRFERVNNWGGFMNTNLYMVNYKKDFTITRIE